MTWLKNVLIFMANEFPIIPIEQGFALRNFHGCLTSIGKPNHLVFMEIYVCMRFIFTNIL